MKSFLEEYGFSILAAIVVIVLIMMVSPVGIAIRESLGATVAKFTATADNGLQTADNTITQTLNNIGEESSTDEENDPILDDNAPKVGDYVKFNGITKIISGINKTCQTFEIDEALAMNIGETVNAASLCNPKKNLKLDNLTRGENGIWNYSLKVNDTVYSRNMSTQYKVEQINGNTIVLSYEDDGINMFFPTIDSIQMSSSDDALVVHSK